MYSSLLLPLRILLVFFLCLANAVNAAEEEILVIGPRRRYSRGDKIPVSCLNRTIETGEHIQNELGFLEYVAFPVCNETLQPLAFAFDMPMTQTCTILDLPDELYHLMEFFVHSDVPLTCRVPSYPISSDSSSIPSSISDGAAESQEQWTPFTIALQGTLQLSHLHLHTNINVLFHTSQEAVKSKDKTSHLIASTAYSLPNSTDPDLPAEGTKIIRNEPLVLTFNVGWIDGAVLPGMVGRPVLGVKDHNIGFSLLSFFALAASAGVGAMGMLVYERRKKASAKYANGLLGGNIGNGTVRMNGYGGYGGYTSSTGKRD